MTIPPLYGSSIGYLFTDRRDVLILGNDKADQHLPWLLPKNVDTFPELAGTGSTFS